MDWKFAYVIYRVGTDGTLSEVFQHDDLKKARYWLKYIAQPGDLLCRTPIHPKHSHSTAVAEYMEHKSKSGTPATDQNDWETQAKTKNFGGSFPSTHLALLS